VSDTRFKLTIAYDGTPFHGWHSGRSGRGVSDYIEKALAEIMPSAPMLVGSSRTDSGVHARGLVAHFDLPASDNRFTGRRLVAALNALLPPEIRIMSAARTCAAFDARFGATWKQYRYQIWNHPVMNPLLHGRAWHVPQPLDIQTMRSAATSLTGIHDFRAYTSKRDGYPLSATRNLHRCEIRRSGPMLTIILQADGFLYKMCRGIVGTLVRTGRGLMMPDEVKQFLLQPAARTQGTNAPAHGLFLWKVSYRPL
jgi:tRNA pseudouridine38-40 synthase